jgi:glycosyltransferase involved in cell wall biosynthesis
VELLGDREMAVRLGRNARKTILEGFSWSATARKTIDVYESLL